MNFVKLTGYEEAEFVWCNLDNVKAMSIANVGITHLFFGDGDTAQVTETPDEILELAKGTTE